jgi:hypothetical protein
MRFTLFGLALGVAATAATAETLICTYKDSTGADFTLTLNIEGDIAKQRTDDANPYQVVVNNETGIVLGRFFALTNPYDKRFTNAGAHMIVIDKKSGVMKRGTIWTSDNETGQLVGRCAPITPSKSGSM